VSERQEWNGQVWPVVVPSSVEEAGAVIREARSRKEGIFPRGRGTQLEVGYPPSRSGIILETTAWQQVVDYPSRDLTITVQAGISVGQLQAVLAEQGQWLPVDVPQAATATLGGSLAVNVSGPRRYGYGTWRDYVIGIRFLQDEGVEVQGGGRVVKNVAGYDLMKLQIGALGTLGVITQVTLKVRPKPERSTAILFGSTAEELGPMLDLLHRSATRPVAVEAMNQATWDAMGLPPSRPDTPWLILVGYEEKAVTVDWQVRTVQEEVRRAGVSAEGIELAEPEALWQRITDWPSQSPRPVVEKVRVRPSRVADALRQAAQTEDWVHAHALSGILWRHRQQLPHPENTDEDRGILWRVPPQSKGALWLWGADPPASTWAFLRELKRTLDPDNVFNPGRLFGDL
jgi:glycolate oxidase FAD binding subunit